MKAYFKFLQLSLMYAVLWEGATHLIVLRHPKVFVLIILTYIPILSLFYLITRFTIAKSQSVIFMILSYIILGLIGLIGLEWCLLQNSPQSNPNANQISMFCYWASIGFIPYLMQDKSEKIVSLTKKFKRFFVSFWCFSWIIGLILPMPARFVISILLMMLGYCFMTGYVFSFIAKDSESKNLALTV